MLRSGSLMRNQSIAKNRASILYIRASDNETGNLKSRLPEISTRPVYLSKIDAAHGKMLTGDSVEEVKRCIEKFSEALSMGGGVEAERV